MSDETEENLLDGPDEPSGGGPSIEPTPDTGSTVLDGTLPESVEPVEPIEPAGPGPGRRLAGFAALLLGIIGSVVAVALAAIMIRAGFSASDTAEQAMEPVILSFARLETRIDQTDDLVDRDGIEADRIDELRARVDGLVDIATGTNQSFGAVEDDPVYGLLPADLSSLGTALDSFEQSAEEVDTALRGLGGGEPIAPPVATDVAVRLDAMQAQVSAVQGQMNDSQTSLRRWIRFGSFLGFLGSLWLLWSQISLARRGWRGFRARPV